ncbi:MAG: class I SAM-dependent methyltransferase [Acidimicrobiia bacterium]
MTHGLPLPEAKLDEKVDLSLRHVAAVGRHAAKPVDAAAFFEFGAGWDLAMPLLLYCLGVERQTVVDIRPLRRPELVFAMAERLRTRSLPEAFARRPRPRAAEPLDAFLREHGITYLAPCDAGDTGLPAGSVDVVTSTNTLEHIPGADIIRIMRECGRLLAPGGILSQQIDYQDHYAYFDRSVTVYNFLRYDERRWRWFNPTLHFQTRLRHCQYLELFAEAGLEVVACETVDGSNGDQAAIAALPPAPQFRAFTADELAVRRSRVVLRPAGDR